MPQPDVGPRSSGLRLKNQRSHAFFWEILKLSARMPFKHPKALQEMLRRLAAFVRRVCEGQPSKKILQLSHLYREAIRADGQSLS